MEVDGIKERERTRSKRFFAVGRLGRIVEDGNAGMIVLLFLIRVLRRVKWKEYKLYVCISLLTLFHILYCMLI